jgi:hypothetical protein
MIQPHACLLAASACRDFTNTSLQDWWVTEFFLGKNGAGGGNKWVDGCFSDDVGGLPQEHEQAIARMGYTSEQTHALQVATQQTWQKAVDKLAAAGGYNWQCDPHRPSRLACHRLA